MNADGITFMTSENPEQELYNELAYYTLAHGDPSFIHQLVVDAFTAQHADENTKPIAITFALIGLYLHLEKGYTGRQVQLAHMKLAGGGKRQWPKFALPDEKGAIWASDVLAAPPGPERDRAIERWCASVWDAHKENRDRVIDLLRQTHLIP